MKKLLKGVYKRTDQTGRDSFVASFTYRTKHISLGGFEKEQLANAAYNEALRISDKERGIALDEYSEKSPLPFEKWVIIINFRDNGLYIKNPIYLRRRYFEYFLSPDEIMKFDADDLFYYSNHKIIRRGNHFFLSDYGMQVNLLHRYGIRSFAVTGRDYVFLNGDRLDFRYENLKIINRYIGVILERELPKPVYVTKIHIRGSVIVGRFDDEITAAVAYNKAAFLLTERGFQRKYELNYIDNLSEKEYEELFNEIKLAKRFMSLLAGF